MNGDLVRRAAAAAAGLWASETALGERRWAMGGLRCYEKSVPGGGWSLAIVSPGGTLTYEIRRGEAA